MLMLLMLLMLMMLMMLMMLLLLVVLLLMLLLVLLVLLLLLTHAITLGRFGDPRFALKVRTVFFFRHLDFLRTHGRSWTLPGLAAGADGQNTEMEANRLLVERPSESLSPLAILPCVSPVLEDS